MADTRVLVEIAEYGAPTTKIGPRGLSASEALNRRLDDIRDAVTEGAQAIAESLAGLPQPEAWHLGEVSAKFGIALTAEAGVIISRASVGATFEVTVIFTRQV
jgi:hypothetical protein